VLTRTRLQLVRCPAETCLDPAWRMKTDIFKCERVASARLRAGLCSVWVYEASFLREPTPAQRLQIADDMQSIFHSNSRLQRAHLAVCFLVASGL
jgi:hypothetical protein